MRLAMYSSVSGLIPLGQVFGSDFFFSVKHQGTHFTVRYIHAVRRVGTGFVFSTPCIPAAPLPPILRAESHDGLIG